MFPTPAMDERVRLIFCTKAIKGEIEIKKDRPPVFMPCTVIVCLHQRFYLPKTQRVNRIVHVKQSFLNCHLGAHYTRYTQGRPKGLISTSPSQNSGEASEVIWRTCLHGYLLELGIAHDKVAPLVTKTRLVKFIQ